jgi:hypothetical protein
MAQPPPTITPPLLEFLQRLFPDRCPTIDMTDRVVWFAAGQASVVKKLAAIRREQEEASLQGTST